LGGKKDARGENYTLIFNNLLNYSLFLKVWKTANVAILKQNKDKALPVSYKPISLTNISKIFEIIINDQIVSLCRTKNIIPGSQF